ncbi:MAG: UDP-3-O-acyl-N-acetylglucosamine deacetylase [Alphaproteobacteria bacterium]|nr:UDP-3-O-acyl-N-acetylglucosamine deacetylase [Alphaproteobacteria bacterium]
MTSSRQVTLARRSRLAGHGVHSGKPVSIILHPAADNHGIRFLRTGLEGGRERLIAARHDAVSASELCTIIGDNESGDISTIEHLMAALYATGIDNLLVEIDGAEVPIMDGSSAPFIAAIDRAGLVNQKSARRYLRVLKPVRVEKDGKFSELVPYARGFRLTVEIDFTTALIGRQKKTLDLTPESFRDELQHARTFGFLKDVDRLRQAGFALGASLENTVAINGDQILNPEGLRYRDEFIRHKMLDAVGDLALSGLPIIGHFRSWCSGHRMNVAVLDALFADRTAYETVEDSRAEAVIGPVRTRVAAIACAPAVD